MRCSDSSAGSPTTISSTRRAHLALGARGAAGMDTGRSVAPWAAGSSGSYSIFGPGGDGDGIDPAMTFRFDPTPVATSSRDGVLTGRRCMIVYRPCLTTGALSRSE